MLHFTSALKGELFDAVRDLFRKFAKDRLTLSDFPVEDFCTILPAAEKDTCAMVACIQIGNVVIIGYRHHEDGGTQISASTDSGKLGRISLPTPASIRLGDLGFALGNDNIILLRLSEISNKLELTGIGYFHGELLTRRLDNQNPDPQFLHLNVKALRILCALSGTKSTYRLVGSRCRSCQKCMGVPMLRNPRSGGG